MQITCIESYSELLARVQEQFESKTAPENILTYPHPNGGYVLVQDVRPEDQHILATLLRENIRPVSLFTLARETSPSNWSHDDHIIERPEGFVRRDTTTSTRIKNLLDSIDEERTYVSTDTFVRDTQGDIAFYTHVCQKTLYLVQTLDTRGNPVEQHLHFTLREAEDTVNNTPELLTCHVERIACVDGVEVRTPLTVTRRIHFELSEPSDT